MKKYLLGLLVSCFIFISSVTLASADTYHFQSNLTIGSRGTDVSLLQSILISDGYLTAVTAPTGYFGRFTRTAVGQLQSSKGISPAVGFFGPITRATVNGMTIITGTSSTTSASQPQPQTQTQNNVYPVTSSPTITYSPTITPPPAIIPPTIIPTPSVNYGYAWPDFTKVFSLSNRKDYISQGCNDPVYASTPDMGDWWIGRVKNGDPVINGQIITPACSKSFTSNGGQSLSMVHMDWNSTPSAIARFNHIILDTTTSIPVNDSGSISNLWSAYDPSLVMFKGEYWVSFECALNNFHGTGVSGCIAPLILNSKINGPEGYMVDRSRISVVVYGNCDKKDSAGTCTQYTSASVPTLLVHNDSLYMYWDALVITPGVNQNIAPLKQVETFKSITQRGVLLSKATSGKMYASGNSSAISSDDDATSIEVLPNADVQQYISYKGNILVSGNLNGNINGKIEGNCILPLNEVPHCRRQLFAQSQTPLTKDVFKVIPSEAGGLAHVDIHDGIPDVPATYYKFVYRPDTKQTIFMGGINWSHKIDTNGKPISFMTNQYSVGTHYYLWPDNLLSPDANPPVPSSPAPTLQSIRLTSATTTLSLGKTIALTSTTLDQYGNPISVPLLWTSSNLSVATVDASGVVTAVSGGTANITASNGSVVSQSLNFSIPSSPATPSHFGWDYDLKHECMRTTGKPGDINYFELSTQCPSGGQHWVITNESEPGISATIPAGQSYPGPASRSFPINATGSPISVDWIPHTNSLGKNWSVHLKVDTNKYSKLKQGFFTFVGMMDHVDEGGGPLPKPLHLQTSHTISYNYVTASSTDASRMIVGAALVWGGKLHLLEINLNTSKNWGKSFKGDPSAIVVDSDFYHVGDTNGKTKTEFVMLDGSQFGLSIPLNKETTIKIPWSDIIAKVIAKGWFTPAIGNQDSYTRSVYIGTEVKNKGVASLWQTDFRIDGK